MGDFMKKNACEEKNSCKRGEKIVLRIRKTGETPGRLVDGKDSYE